VLILALPAVASAFAQHPSLQRQRSSDWLPALIDIEGTGPVSACHTMIVSGIVMTISARRTSGNFCTESGPTRRVTSSSVSG
jgi:hypothetical protein